MGARKRPYPGRVRREKRKKSALEYYDLGKSFGFIAKELGCSRTEAFRLVQDGLLEVRIDPEEVAKRRSLRVSQIEKQLEVWAEKSLKGDSDASREARGWHAQLKDLEGTAAPTKQEIEGPAPVTIVNEAPSMADMARLVRESFGSHAAVKQPDGGLPNPVAAAAPAAAAGAGSVPPLAPAR